MRWQSKALTQAVLSRVPFHQRVYRWLHATFGEASRTLGDQLDRKLNLIGKMQTAGVSVEDRVVMEIGTGWRPVSSIRRAINGVVYHHVNPGDHFASKDGVTTVNFLKYSPSAWYFIGGFGVAYHNRLRCVDYLRMVTDAGFEVVDSYTNTDPRAVAELEGGALRVHTDFDGYTCEQLACNIIGVFAKPAPNT